jgi:hypothetical protein
LFIRFCGTNQPYKVPVKRTVGVLDLLVGHHVLVGIVQCIEYDSHDKEVAGLRAYGIHTLSEPLRGIVNLLSSDTEITLLK